MKTKILFIDDIHFHERNFSSLFEFLEIYNVKYKFVKHKNKDLLTAYGKYDRYTSVVLDKVRTLEALSQEELFDYSYHAINLFKVSRAEILSYVLTLQNWYSQSIEYDHIITFNKLFIEDKETLILNMAMSMYWIDFWIDYLKNSVNYSHVCIFSGSLIYQKVLIEIAKNTSMNVMLFEHFFTGYDYYCEHKYEHIANNSDIKFKNYYDNILNVKKLDYITFQQKKKKAILQVLNAVNKNVKQPEKEDKKLFNNNNKTLLILGQVINDFSIIETNLKNIVSLEFYKELILKVIQNTDYNIIFKAHPWERQKANLMSSLTYNELMKFVFDKKFQERIVLVEDYNIESLFEQSNLICTICSQSAIEAALTGKKVVQFGNAFYGNKGFTYDYSNIDDFIKDLENLKEILSIEEYKKYEIFLLKVLQLHLVSTKNSGILKLENIFKVKHNSIISKSKNVDKIKKIKYKYEDSYLKVIAQKIKKIPVFGRLLLVFKHRILKWDK